MSRSYKKPIVTDGQKKNRSGFSRRAHAKRLAARVVRSATDIANGSAYRKVSDSWSICDYKFDMRLSKDAQYVARLKRK